MVEIMHQFSDKDFYIPNWEVKNLFIGTFNPNCGEKVKYYYGREKNKTWEILSKIFEEQFDTNSKDFLDKIKIHKIACMDLIHSVTVCENSKQYICGKGYSDNKIINNYVTREYNTEKINKIISENLGLKIYSTWGSGSTLKEWKNQVSKIDNGMIKLKSPSMAAKVGKGVQKFPYMLNDWTNKILLQK